MLWEYRLVYATYEAFPRRDAHSWEMRSAYDNVRDEFIRAQEATKIRLWADGKWQELGLDPDVDWHGVRQGKVIWDPWVECLRLEEDGLNAFGQRGWEVVAAQPCHEAEPDEYRQRAMVYLLKRPLAPPKL